MLFFLSAFSRKFQSKIYLGPIMAIHLITCLWCTLREPIFESGIDNYLYSLNWIIATIKSYPNQFDETDRIQLFF